MRSSRLHAKHMLSGAQKFLPRGTWSAGKQGPFWTTGVPQLSGGPIPSPHRPRIACAVLLSSHAVERGSGGAPHQGSSSSAALGLLPQHHPADWGRHHSSNAASGSTPAGDPVLRVTLTGPSERTHGMGPRHGAEPVGAGASATHSGGHSSDGETDNISDQVRQIFIRLQSWVGCRELHPIPYFLVTLDL